MNGSGFLSNPVISVLDFGIVAPGRAAASVLQETLDLAANAERLGYSAFWVSEHHEAHFAWVGPATVIGALAQRTRHIRLGAAAVLLPLYSPLVIAEMFRTLSALTPGRIDLGVCAGIPLDQVAFAALSDRPIKDVQATPAGFPQKLADLDAYLHGRFPEGHRFANGATPCHAAPPPLWVMGSSENTARLAANCGANFAYSLFHRSSKQDPAAVRVFREISPQQADGARRRVNVAATCICSDDSRVVGAQRQMVEHWLQGDMRVVIAGSPSECREQIFQLAERFDADEVTLFHLWHEPQPRLSALIALAGEFQLKSRPAIGGSA